MNFPTLLRKTQSQMVNNDRKNLQSHESIKYLEKQNQNGLETIKQTEIIVIDSNQNSNNGNLQLSQHNQRNNFVKSYTLQQKTQKMSSTIRQALKKRAKQFGNYRQSAINRKISPLSQSILQRFNKIEKKCGICLGLVHENEVVLLCKCTHFFCKNCIRDYVTYKIKMYEEVSCPEEECDHFMSQETDFFKNLSEEIKKQYKKVHNFYVTSNDPSLRLCPKENCEGIIKIIEGKPRVCGQCKKDFCPKCFMEKHLGSCDQVQILFLQNNLHYRQCQNCKIIVQRTQGCNHMTCKCKYQFCYLCGKKWTGSDHLCNPKDIQILDQAQVQVREELQQPLGFFDQYGFCSSCHCLNESIMQLPIRVLSCFVFSLFTLLFGVFLVLKVLCYLLFAIIMGLFVYSVKKVIQFYQDGNPSFVYFICLFPVLMFITMFIAIYELFPNMAGTDITNFWNFTKHGYRHIWQ